MMSRPCIGGGMVTAIPDWNDPIVVTWGPTAIDSEASAGAAHMRHEERLEDEVARQAMAEYLTIRARA